MRRKAYTQILVSRWVIHAAAVYQMEYFFTCPYCWQRISMVLDTSVKGQTFIEDCEVCCQPIQLRYSVQDDEVIEFEATALE